MQEEALSQAKSNLDNVQKKYDVGSASGFDKMRAEVEMANLQPEVISARNNLQSALTRLRITLGLASGTQIETDGTLFFTAEDFDSLSLIELQQMAIKNRPDIEVMKQQKEISEESITIAFSSFLPKLFFATDYSYLAARNDLKFSGNDFSKGFTSAISLQIPLFEGFRSSHEYQKAKIDMRIRLPQKWNWLSINSGRHSRNIFQPMKRFAWPVKL